MPQLTLTQRTINGAKEGASTGVVVAVIRAIGKAVREGIPHDLGAHLPEVVVFFFSHIVCCSYVFAMGRGIANGLTGAILGTLVFSLGGIFAAADIPYDPKGIAYPLILGAIGGVAVGAPLGAAVQRLFANRNKPKSR